MLEENIAAWMSELTTAMLHQVTCNSTTIITTTTSIGLISCAEQCGLLPISYDHLCIVERANETSQTVNDSNFTSMPYTKLFCRPCDFSSCDINVSLVLNGLEGIEGAFLSTIPRLKDCNSSFFADVCAKVFIYVENETKKKKIINKTFYRFNSMEFFLFFIVP